MRIDGTVTAAVTGGARGIGAAIAEELTARGASVVIGDVEVRRAERTAARLGARALPLDVASSESWGEFVGSAGPIDVLVNNAGLMPIGRFVDETDASTRRQLDVNVLGVILGCRAVLPGMLERRRGSLVNVASQAGKAGFAGVATYSATKFAVVGLCQSLSDELRGTPVRVTCVLPGLVDTELSAGMEETPLTRRVSPDEVARAVADGVERGTRELWVPASGRFAVPAAGRVPPRLRDRVSRLIGHAEPVLGADAAARAEYEARIADSPTEVV